MAEIDGLRRIVVWTDGGSNGPATRNSPAPIGAGIILQTEGERAEYAVALGVGTCQQAELLAIRTALSLIRDRPDTCVTIVTDSRYCCGTLMPSDWKLKHNVELIQRIRQLMAEFRQVRMKWVKGHDDHQENERADYLAGLAVGRNRCRNNDGINIVGESRSIRVESFPSAGLTTSTSPPSPLFD